MRRNLQAWVLLCSLLFLTPIQAVTIKGQDIPESIAVGKNNTRLVLNGAGIRSKFFFSIYIGSLYVPQKHKDVRILEAMPGYKRVEMRFLYDEVEGSKLAKGWEEGFVNNQNDAQMKLLRARLDNFKQLFPTVKQGDVIWIDYVPDIGTQVRLNTRLLGGSIQGADFYRALMRVWLGDEPADESLKQGMLGISEGEE
jgi:hypothetical protein